MEEFDLAVIGSGPGGFSAAMRGVDFGEKVCLIEAKHLGGAGIINGALTSKTMWELSRDYAVAARVDRGYRASALSVSYDEVRKTVIQAAKDKQYQMLSQIETFRESRNGSGTIVLKYGWARFIDQTTLEISGEYRNETIKTKKIVIATGARPRKLPGLDVDQERIINSEGILNLKKFPERMIIIGSGIIGCEFATIFSNFKQTEIHLIDHANRVIPFEDDDLSDFVSGNLSKNGVQIHHTARLRTIRKHKDFLEAILDYSDGHSKVIEVDVALVSIGREPNTKNLGLENVGINPTERGFLDITDSCAIDNKYKLHNIYAAGDITGHAQLYSVAEFQGRFAVEDLNNAAIYPMDYSGMSTLMFFTPEVAAVGMNEKKLRAKKVPYKVVYYANSMVNRAIAMRNTNGFVKIILSDNGEDRILGMRAAGPQASAFIVSVAHLINQGNSLYEIMRIFYPHPSLTEGIQEAMRVFNGKSLFKPDAFPEHIQIRHWKLEE